MIIKEPAFFAPASSERMLHIYLPDDYDRSDERYPVMYFFDGHNLFFDEDATYGKSWGLKTFLDNWYKKMIIVGIECSHEGDQRLDEYCPYEGHLGKRPLHGTGKATMDWITGTLKPSIDNRFRTYSFREATAIGGSSMGGLMSLYAVLLYNNVFSKAACVSSTISSVRKPMFDAMRNCPLNPDTRIYLSWGTKENWWDVPRRDNIKAEEVLQQRGVSTYLYCQKGGGHCEADWEKQIPLFMDYLW